MYARLRSFVTERPILPLALCTVLVLLPQLGMVEYWQRQVILVAIYTLLCSGLNLSFGYAGELALGQVAVFAAGAYISAILFNQGHTDIVLGFVVAVMLAGFAGLISGLPGVRLSQWSLALVSFFLVLLIPSLTSIFSEYTGGNVGLSGLIGPTLFGYELTDREFYVVAVIVTMVWMLVFRNLVVSRFGSSLRALAESPTLAETLGTSVFGLRVQAYVIGALPAGLAGVLYTYLSGFLSPEAFTLSVLIAVFAATVVGGADSIWGAPVGAALLVLGPMQISSFEEYSTVVYGAFLVMVGALFAPGIAGLVRSLRSRVTLRLRGRGDVAAGAKRTSDQAALSIPGEALEVQGVEKGFAGLKALNGTDLTAEPGTITAIIGPNGAGKTTLLNLVSGVLRTDGGTVRLGGRQLTGMRPFRVSRLGVGRTFQTPMIPGSMSVLHVVESGRLRYGDIGLLSTILRMPSFYRVRAADRKAALAALSFAGLGSLASQDAGSLPLGTRRLLEVVRAVAGAPNVLLLDEPAAGLDDEGLRELKMLMKRSRDAGGTVVFVEHNVPFVMEVADQVFVMELGRVIASGPPEVVRNDQRVVDSYLGRRGARSQSSVDENIDLEVT